MTGEKGLSLITGLYRTATGHSSETKVARQPFGSIDREQEAIPTINTTLAIVFISLIQPPSILQDREQQMISFVSSRPLGAKA
ncbi:hypothetical protein [Rhizobium sp. RCC_161_2]|uniref:hypothetical protein n=1 Tax=Rhizobium sp. RCC_161_2 TaxID=3239219 RepID=UPI0035236821